MNQVLYKQATWMLNQHCLLELGLCLCDLFSTVFTMNFDVIQEGELVLYSSQLYQNQKEFYALGLLISQ